ncbi:hypothetical protein L195_g060338, partial [Trifolium pratense]
RLALFFLAFCTTLVHQSCFSRVVRLSMAGIVFWEEVAFQSTQPQNRKMPQIDGFKRGVGFVPNQFSETIQG